MKLFVCSWELGEWEGGGEGMFRNARRGWPQGARRDAGIAVIADEGAGIKREVQEIVQTP